MSFSERNISDSNSSLNPKEVEDKIAEYTKFVQDVLQPQLQIAVDAREYVENEIAEYEELLQELHTIFKRYTPSASNTHDEDYVELKSATPLESLVDLGHKIAYCRAIVNDPTTIFVNVGFGFHVEFTLKEALEFIPRRINYLKQNVLIPKADKAREIADHFKNSLFVLERLSLENESAIEKQSQKNNDSSGKQLREKGKTISWYS